MISWIYPLLFVEISLGVLLCFLAWRVRILEKRTDALRSIIQTNLATISGLNGVIKERGAILQEVIDLVKIIQESMHNANQD